MPADSAGTDVQATSAFQPTMWRLARLSLIYLMDAIDIARRGGDVIDCLLFSAIIEANVAHVRKDPALQAAYATMNTPVPDDLRRPISISALAHSLRLPFETVRRRIGHMVEAGDCVILPKGVVVTRAILMKPEIQMMAGMQYARLRELYLDLRAEGLSPLLRPDDLNVEPLGDLAPVRAVVRILSEYIMRFIDNVMLRLGDPLTALVLLHMTLANTEHLTAQEREALPVPDHLRRPVSVVSLARRLHTPPETVRRRALWLEEQGFIVRTTGGLMVSAAGAQRPGVVATVGDNLADLNRMFGRLNRLGLLAMWDGEAGISPKVSAA
jgi:DNA-binding Lrp family transcriptional regulator